MAAESPGAQARSARVAPKSYKSPQHKLVSFFAQSRDQWKAKCQGAKATLKQLKKKVQRGAARQRRHQARLHALVQEVSELQAENRRLAAALATEKKSAGELRDWPARLPAFTQRVGHHHFSLGMMGLFLALVLSAAVSLRGASRVLELWSTGFALPEAAPAWSTGRLWLLRLGYYKLTRPKAQATDWVWIMDHTIQLGAQKCLLILGVRLSALPPPGRCLRHEDVEPLARYPVPTSNGDVVYQQLTAAMAHTGVPREILSDGGSDLQAGIAQFQAAHPETQAIYDIKHKTALVLKHELADDPLWKAFTQQAAQTKQRVQQTPLAFLAPPTQRRKARYMNVDILMRWGTKALAYLAQPHRPEAQPVTAEQLAAAYGWLQDFRAPLQDWAELRHIVETTEHWVRSQGLSPGTARALTPQVTPLVRTARGQRVAHLLLTFVETEAAKAAPHERLLGSSEVIESVFGKLKRLEQHQARSGFTGLVLAVGALVAPTTPEVIQQALETVPTSQVRQWCQQHLGPSVQAQRQHAFRQHKPEEENQVHFQQAA